LWLAKTGAGAGRDKGRYGFVAVLRKYLCAGFKKNDEIRFELHCIF
jgi:hypothetical protein